MVKEHLNWHANASKAGFIAIKRLIITNLISYLSEQQIIFLQQKMLLKIQTKTAYCF
jgi:hypothetical protein